MIPKKVEDFLISHGLTYTEHEPGSTATAEMAAARNGVEVGQIVKTMLCVSKDGQRFLVLCPGDRKINSSKLKAATGVGTKFATAEETYQLTGYHPGGVCPFAVENIEILADASLSRFDVIFPAAGNNASGVPISFQKLVEITSAKVVSVTKED